MEQYFIDSALCNFADKKTGDPVLVDSNFVSRLRSACCELSCAWNWSCRNGLADIDLSSIDKYLSGSIIAKILDIGPNNMVLAGGSIRSIMIQNDKYSDFDIFFYNISVDDAEKLLNNCLDYINRSGRIVKCHRSQYVITVVFRYANKYFDVQFIKRIYQSKSQVLLGFDIAGAKLLWDKSGFATTIDGAVAVACGGFVLDLTQKSVSFAHRLMKYNTDKKYAIYFPNIIGKKFDHVKIDNFTVFLNEFSYNLQPLLSDYEGNTEGFSNCLHIMRGKDYYVQFIGNSLKDITELGDDIVGNSILRDTTAYSRKFNENSRSLPRLSFKIVRKFLGETDYKAFIKAYCFAHDNAAVQKIWEQATERYIEAGKKIAIHIKNPANSWKIDDPTSQYFGKFNPIKTSTRDCIGAENYVPFVVGLSNDRVIMFRLCCNRYIYVPADIDNLLLKWWFWAEVYDARNRLGL